MRVTLVDVGSAIPNLALMKLSAYHKGRGDTVSLLRMGGRVRTIPLEAYDGSDRAYVSCVFTWQAELGTMVAEYLRRRGLEVSVGGTGFDWGREPGTWSALPSTVEQLPPDYSLYGDRRAIGFCQRGCDRKCHFCVVWRKEGTIAANPYVHPSQWVPDGFDRALLLDNDLALYGYERQAEILRWFGSAGVRVSITQGYDIRCVAQDERLAPLVAECKPWDLKFHGRRLFTAWDYLGIEVPFRRGMERLLAAGFRGREVCVYMICGAPDPVTGLPRDPAVDHAEALHRFNAIREFGAYPYVMTYNKRADDPWLNRFARYVNRCVFTSCSWEEYDRGAYERRRRAS